MHAWKRQPERNLSRDVVCAAEWRARVLYSRCVYVCVCAYILVVGA